MLPSVTYDMNPLRFREKRNKKASFLENLFHFQFSEAPGNLEEDFSII